MSLDEFKVSQLMKQGVGFKDLLTLPWELVPFSFVFDWFVNVGDRLRAAVPTSGFKELGSCTTVTRVDSVRGTAQTATPNAGYTIISYPSGSFDASYELKTRYAGLMAPRLVLKGDFRFSNIIRTLDALSLCTVALSAAFGGKSSRR
jgi:hypothetical protein